MSDAKVKLNTRAGCQSVAATNATPNHGALLALTAWVVWRPAPQSGNESVASVGPVEDDAEQELQSAPQSIGREQAHAAETQPAARPAGPAALAGSEATLILQVVAKETGAPMGGIEIFINEHRAGWSAEGFSESNGGWITTDARGRLAWSPEVGVALELDVGPTDPALASSAHLEIPALAPGERRDLVVQLANTQDLGWFGQIVDGTSHTPLAGARAGRVQDDPFGEPLEESPASTSDGLLSLTFHSWRSSFARIELEGYSTSFVQLDAGHEQSASAFPVRLLRAATLELLVTDPSGAARLGELRAGARSEHLVAIGRALRPALVRGGRSGGHERGTLHAALGRIATYE